MADRRRLRGRTIGGFLLEVAEANLSCVPARPKVWPDKLWWIHFPHLHAASQRRPPCTLVSISVSEHSYGCEQKEEAEGSLHWNKDDDRVRVLKNNCCCPSEWSRLWNKSASRRGSGVNFQFAPLMDRDQVLKCTARVLLGVPVKQKLEKVPIYCDCLSSAPLSAGWVLKQMKAQQN